MAREAERPFALRLGAPAFGVDGLLGPLMALVLDAHARRVEYTAVRNGDVPDAGRLVSARDLLRAEEDRLDLDLDRRRFFTLPRFIVPYHVEQAQAAQPPSALWFATSGFTFAVHERVPPGLLAIDRSPDAVDTNGDTIGVVEVWSIDRDEKRVVGVSVRRRHERHGPRVLYGGQIISRITTSQVVLELNSAQQTV